MLSYQEYEKSVYEWLLKRNEKDPSFNFSVRQKASKGSELDYFIGTEKSKYFGTTFWHLPVNYPGSSTDCINLFFFYAEEEYGYYFEFNQTKSPYNEQNELVLELIQNLKPRIKSEFGLLYESASFAKMESYKSKPKNELYKDLDKMFDDIDREIDIILSVVDNKIEAIKNRNSNFIAHRLTNKEFQQLKQKMERRFEKHSNLTSSEKDSSVISTDKVKYWLYSPGSNADMWDDFYEDGIIALQQKWDRLGEFFALYSKEDIARKLRKLDEDEGSKKNDATAIYEFAHVMKAGDIIIVKRGRDELLGYGEVKSNMHYDPKREYFKNYRDIEWKLNGTWKTDVILITKTLTDITRYPTEHPKYNYYYERLMGVMSDEEKRVIPFPLNTILYGSPGTGKTFNTINYALGIIENEEPEVFTGETKEQRREYVERFNKYKKEGQIEFITFHQNYAYEDFIEGIRPRLDTEKLRFERKEGIFKIIADRASKNYLAAKSSKPKALMFDEIFEKRFADLKEGITEEEEIKMKKSSYFITDITEKSIHFRKSNGDSKHSMSISTLGKMFEESTNTIIKGGLQPYYEPLLNDLLQFSAKQKVNVNEKVELKKYVLVIDEINRANISRVFGELITLIEKDKRLGEINELKATLPSGEEFALSPNLFIIGTMNTADKSIALLDIALRRRFNFKAYYPNSDLIEDETLKAIHIAINDYIKEDKGIDFTIGHSYFMNKTEIDLPEILNETVIPLLSEYYMSDLDEVQKVLKKANIPTNTINGFVFYDEISE